MYSQTNTKLAAVNLEWEMFQTKVVQKIKTSILCPKKFLKKKSYFYEILWKNLPEAVLIQSVSPDDEHDMLETCREL